MNSEEIAKLANVSRSTVSRVVNNYKNVPNETREKVQKIIDEYGYTPNTSARTLAGKSNNIIGLFIADINTTNSNKKWIGTNSPYNAELLAQVIASCKRRGYLTLVNTISELSECEEMGQYFSNRLLFGGIFIGFPYGTKELEELVRKGHNIVLIDQLTEEDDLEHKIKLFNCDNVQGGYLATKYFIEKGFSYIAHITGDDRLSSIQRQQGYRKALEEHGVRVNKNLIVDGEYREDVAYLETLRLIDKERVDAIFVGNDIMALGVVRAIEERGLQVPDDISVIGFDNLESAEWINLELTTLEIPMVDIAEQSVGLLFSKEVGRHLMCQPQLIERKSVLLNKKSSL